MRRREFLGLSLATSLAAHPRLAQAEDARLLGIALSYNQSDPEIQERVQRLLAGLNSLGWVEDRNVRIEYRWATTEAERARVAQELVSLRPDVIVTSPTPITRAVQKATSTIPILFVNVSDPVGEEFVTQLARPHANLTGFINFEAEMGGKWVELLKELAPDLEGVALMYNPATAPGRGGEYFTPSFEAAARLLGPEPVLVKVRSHEEIETSIDHLGAQTRRGLVVASDSFLVNSRKHVLSAALRNKLPAVYPQRYFAREGGVLAYGPDHADSFFRASAYVDRLLRGAQVRELPVQLPTKFELSVNTITARQIGLTVPPALLARANEVIE